MKNNIKILIGIILVMIILNACETRESEKTEIIQTDGEWGVRGWNEISTTLTIPAGTTVKFEDIKKYTSFFGESTETAGLVINNGGKLVAVGTSSSTIVFEEGPIEIQSNASSESSIKYCKFNGGSLDIVGNSASIEYCKFINSHYMFLMSGLFQHNSLNTEAKIIIKVCTSLEISYSEFDYNNAYDGPAIKLDPAQGFGFTPPTISNNNLTNINSYAISYEVSGSTITISTNYIADCNGKTGADTTGEQSHNVIYTNPQISPVSGAGCGW